ncbi:MAG TPA: ssl1498 family light-harvesting-like protein [Coleofasciculaceae cyanobacterium]|jgi:hypothetical protein
MPYTTEEGGLLNNFAAEPKVYEAEPPSSKQRIQYIALGVGALVLVGSLIAVAVAIS